MNKNDLWKAALTELQLTLSLHNFNIWFGQTFITKIKKIKKDVQLVEIATPNSYFRDTINKRYGKRVKEILDRITGIKNRLSFIIQEQSAKAPLRKDFGPLFSAEKILERQRKKQAKRAIAQAKLRAGFTFEDFAVSSTNEMAHAAATAVAKNPGKAYNPLFLYGGVGVGKTHLMQAIAHRVLSKKPSATLIYCTGEEFTNEIIDAIQTKKTKAFKEKFRKVKLLLIDDVQFIAGKDSVQEELFHTFNAVHQIGGQVVLTSDKSPAEIEKIEERLRSRFEWGLTIDIQQPNFELRTAILLIKAKRLKSPIPMDAAQAAAANIFSIRKLEGFLIRLITESQTKNIPITPLMVESLLNKEKDASQEVKKKVESDEVINTVASYFNLRLSQIKGIRRLKTIVLPRQIAMYFLRHDLGLTNQAIGKLFGGKDHTTVMHSVEKITKNISLSEELRNDVFNIRKNFGG